MRDRPDSTALISGPKIAARSRATRRRDASKIYALICYRYVAFIYLARGAMESRPRAEANGSALSRDRQARTTLIDSLNCRAAHPHVDGSDETCPRRR